MSAGLLRPPGVGYGERAGAFVLALAMHLLLAAMLLIGLRWQSHAPVAVQAELWVPPPPAPAAVPAPVPQPPRPAPRAAPIEPPVPKPDIATESQRREKLAKAERERSEKAERERAEKAERERAEKIERERVARQEQARRKAEAQEKARQDAAARREAEARKAEQARLAAEEQVRKDEEARARSRDEYLRRTLEQAGRPGAAVGAEAGGAQGAAMGSWGAKVSSHIRANTVFAIPPDLRGNPKAEFALSIMPDGSIAGLRLMRSSGVPGWDQAAERAIRRADPLPRPPPGTPRDITIAHGPRDE
jgi:colicin import membrane protein